MSVSVKRIASRKCQRDRGIVIIPLDSLSFSLFRFLSLFSLSLSLSTPEFKVGKQYTPEDF